MVTDVVQMAAVDRPAVSSRTRQFEAEESRTEAQEDEDAEMGEVNVDELTRKVYQEIKRRLSSEWERMRRRF